MGQTRVVTKSVVFSEFVSGPDSPPTGHYFVALVTHGTGKEGGYLQRNLTPACWGYDDRTVAGDVHGDEIILGRIFEEIAKANSFTGEDRAQQSLNLIRSAGEEGIPLQLSSVKWEKIEHAPRESFLGSSSPEGITSVPHLER